MPLVSAAGAQMPDGRILVWSARDKLSFGGDQGRTWTAIFDPTTNTAQDALITNTQHDMFCPSINTLPDGRVMVAGGSSSSKVTVYDPYINSWSAADEMNIARGYHASVTLNSGATFLIGGSWSGGTGNKHSEIWTEKSGWFQLPNVLVDAITEGLVSSQPVRHDDYFPWLWTAPNGKIFHAGPNQRMHWIDPTGVGSYTYAGNRGNDEFASSGITVMYDIGKVLKAGGSNTFEEGTPASNRCYSIDFNSDNVSVQQVDNMNWSRMYTNGVVLPTGEVFVTGGIATANVFSDNNSRLTPEMWNPNTGEWTALAPMTVPRNYHSIGLLMQDGRIFLAGGGLCGGCNTNHPDAEIFSPPYLFNPNGSLASRPNIQSAPSTAAYNSAISVQVSGNPTSFSLVRNAGVTHSTGNDQRRIPLSYSSQGGNQYSLTIPGRNLLPPGQYMLFAMKSSGTPSVASIITLGEDIHNCDPVSNPNLGGDGLKATYFNNADLTNEVLTRTDATVDFDWGTGSPASGIGENTFSARWEGFIEVPRSGGYNFYTNSDDGVRLWVNNRLMVDNWTDHSPTEDIGMIVLEAGQQYQIKMEYYENAGGALAQLSWSGPGVLKEIIPTGNLFSDEPDPCLAGGAPSVGSISKEDSECNQNDGSITINFPDRSGRTAIEFSIDGGNTWPGAYNVPDNSGQITIDNLSPGTYDLYVRWGNDECPTDIPNRTIDEVNCGGGGDPDCANIDITTGAGEIQIAGMDGAPITSIHVFASNWSTEYTCFANCQTPTDVISVSNGTYYVYARYYDAGYNLICEVTETVAVSGGTGGGCTDADGDGFCQEDDCDDNDPNFPKPAGTSCDDGNSNTINDEIQGDGCTCAGTPAGSGDCSNINITAGNGQIVIEGLDEAPVVAVKVFTSTWQTIKNCFANCNSPVEKINVPNGSYIVYVTFYDASYNQICQINDTYTVGGGGGGGCTDDDGDGICAEDDCNDNDPDFPKPVGSSCNDGNSSTINDVIQSDGCTCAGTPDNSGNCNISFNSTSNSITISGLSSPITIVQIFDPSWNKVYDCTANCPTTVELDNLDPGTYYCKTSSFTGSWSKICDVNEYVTVGNGAPGRISAASLQFKAVRQGRGVQLLWNTNLDYKAESYTIERSIDGYDFNIILEEESRTMSEHFVDYNQKDEDPLTGNNFYRLTQHYADGTSRTSPTYLVRFEEDLDALVVYPNPSQGILHVDVSKWLQQAVHVKIVSLNGQILHAQDFDQNHSNILSFDLSQWKNGMYQLYLKPQDSRAIGTRVVLMNRY